MVVAGVDVDVDVDVDADDVLVVELDEVVGVVTVGAVTGGTVIWLTQYAVAFRYPLSALA